MISKTIEIIVVSHFFILQVVAYIPDDYEEPPRSKYPYLVSILTADNLSAHICSGSLVGFSWVLTSAHCVKQYANAPENIYLLAGHTGSVEEQIRKAEKIYYHNQFIPDSFFNDIALISTVKPFERNPSINVCYVPKYTMNIEMKTHCKQVQVLGFEEGVVKDKQSGRNITRPVLISFRHSVMSDKDCAKMRKFKVMKHTFCGFAKNMTACLLDTGGPAVCEGLIYGINFYGCPWSGAPSYFTRIDRYLIFIEKIMGAEAPFPLMKRAVSGNRNKFAGTISIFMFFLCSILKVTF